MSKISTSYVISLPVEAVNCMSNLQTEGYFCQLSIPPKPFFSSASDNSTWPPFGYVLYHLLRFPLGQGVLIVILAQVFYNSMVLFLLSYDR